MISCTALTINEALNKGVVTFSYKKNDGTIRVAKGTTKHTTLVAEAAQSKGGMNKVESAGYTSYYDLDKKAWRSFAEGRLIEIISFEG